VEIEDAILVSEDVQPRALKRAQPEPADIRSAVRTIEYVAGIAVAALAIGIVLLVMIAIWGFVAIEMFDSVLNEPVN
jgi:hypothetical protein